MQVCIANIYASTMLSLKFIMNYQEDIIVLFVETPRKFITAKLSIRKPGSSSVLIICDLFHSHALFTYKSVNSFHHPSINNSVCKTLINRAKTICEVSNIDDELEHLRNVLKMNGYPRHFIDNAMKTPQSIQQKIES